jgi:hypothetical protein
MCVRKILWKTDSFGGRYKKTKHVLQKALFLALKIIFFTSDKQQVKFLWNEFVCM